MKTKSHKFTQSGGMKRPISIENDKHSREWVEDKALTKFRNVRLTVLLSGSEGGGLYKVRHLKFNVCDEVC